MRRAKCRCRACAPRRCVECVREIDSEKAGHAFAEVNADVLAYLQRSVRATGDLVLTLGAGDIGGVAHELAAGLSASDAGVASPR